MEYMIMPLKRYFDFSGRSRRKEYWMFVLFQVIVFTVLALLFGGFSAGVDDAALQAGDPGAAALGAFGAAFWIPALLFIIPNLAVQVRRFHDHDKSGWFILLGLIPLIGGFIVLYFMVTKGTPGPNRFGPDPLNPTDLRETFA